MRVVGFRQINLPAFSKSERIIGIGFDGTVEIGERLIILFFAAEGDAAQSEAGPVAGVELDDRIGILQRAVDVAVLQTQPAAQFQEVGIGGEFDGMADVGQGALAVAFLVVGVRP